MILKQADRFAAPGRFTILLVTVAFFFLCNLTWAQQKSILTSSTSQRDAVDILIPSLLQENVKLRDPRICRYLYVGTFVEVSQFKEKLKAKFQGGNDDFYLAEAIVATNA